MDDLFAGFSVQNATNSRLMQQQAVPLQSAALASNPSPLPFNRTLANHHTHVAQKQPTDSAHFKPFQTSPHQIMNDMDDNEPLATPRRCVRRKIDIEYITDKNRRQSTFSKRKAGIMKKAYELATLTGTQVLLLVASENGHVYTFATPKLQPIITNDQGKTLIQSCLNSEEAVGDRHAHDVDPQPLVESDQHAHDQHLSADSGIHNALSADLVAAAQSARLQLDLAQNALSVNLQDHINIQHAASSSLIQPSRNMTRNNAARIATQTITSRMDTHTESIAAAAAAAAATAVAFSRIPTSTDMQSASVIPIAHPWYKSASNQSDLYCRSLTANNAIEACRSTVMTPPLSSNET